MYSSTSTRTRRTRRSSAPGRSGRARGRRYRPHSLGTNWRRSRLTRSPSRRCQRGSRATVTRGCRCPLTVGGSGAAVATAAGAAPVPLAQLLSSHAFLTPPTTADCEAQLHLACYAPFQFQKAYNLGPLYERGMDRQGRDDRHRRRLRLADDHRRPQGIRRRFQAAGPAEVHHHRPRRQDPALDRRAPTRSPGHRRRRSTSSTPHAVAPGSEHPARRDAGRGDERIAGFPQIVAVENYVIDHHLGEVISQSFAAPEQPSPNGVDAQAAQRLHERGGQIRPSSRCSGGRAIRRQDADAAGVAGDHFLPPRHDWPADDPLVTVSVASHFYLNAKGRRPSRPPCGMTPRCSARRLPAVAAARRSSRGRVSRAQSPRSSAARGAHLTSR